MKLLEEVKGSSSKWIKTRDECFKNFYWQDGYGAFSINPSQIDAVVTYINNQHEHHNKKTFQFVCLKKQWLRESNFITKSQSHVQ